MAKQRLTAIISADTTGFKRGMADVKRITANAVKAVAGIGIAGAAAYATAAKATANYLDNIGKTSKRTGIAADELQRLQFAAELSGTSLADLEKGTKRMASVILDMENGLTESKRAFSALSLTLDDVKGKTPTEQLHTMLTALAGISDKSKQAALAQDIFGRAGTQLLPMLSDGAEGFDALRRERERMGPLFTDAEVRAGEELNDAIGRLGLTAKVAIGQLVVSTFPQLIERINATADRIAEFVKSEGFTELKTEAGNLADTIGLAVQQFLGFEEGPALDLAEALRKINEEISAMTANEDFAAIRDTLVDLAKVLGGIAKLYLMIRKQSVGGVKEMLDNIDLVGEANDTQSGRAGRDAFVRQNAQTETLLAKASVGAGLAASEAMGRMEKLLNHIAENTVPLKQVGIH